MNSSFFLLSEESPRSFLKKALELRQKESKLTQNAFAKKAGFSSRSFLSEYLSGKKNLSKDSFQKLKSALWLAKEYKQYFSLLVQKEQPELFNNKAVTTAMIENLRFSIKNQETVLARIGKPSHIVGKADLFRVYASLGSEQVGADYREILSRSKLPESRLKPALDLLNQEGLVTFKEGRFFALTSKVDLLHVKDQELVDLSQNICGEISKEASQMLNEKGSLLFYSCVSISEYRASEFKEKLREAMYQVMDSYQDDRGEEVRQIFLSVKV